MITVILIGHKFQYEIEHLLKAFYPQEEFQFIFTHRVKPSLSLENSKVYIYSVWEGKRFYGEIHVNRKVYQKEYQEDLMDMEEIPRRKKAKRLLKRVLYEAMVLYQKRPLPWGILTGIRPTKIVHELLEHEYSDEKISTILSKQYHIQPDKISLLKQVAKKEKKILDQNKPREISIYIGIPFCPTRCIYCSFTSYPIEKWKDYVDTYIRSLMKEIEAFQYIYKNYPIKSLYIGGGTPTSLSSTQLEILLEALKQCLPMHQIEEFTIEAGRPDTITMKKLEVMKTYHVDRISINPQTMNNETLRRIGRNHKVEDIYKTFEMAKKIGFHSINMDLIVGLPGENIDHVKYTWDQLATLQPDNITVHTMAIKRASQLYKNQKKYDGLTQEEIEKILLFTQEQTCKMGLEPYYLYRQKNTVGNFENVGYCIPGKEGIYNIEIIEEKQTILAFGAGSATKIVDPNTNHIQRIANVKDVNHYIQRVDEMIQRKKEWFN